MIQKSSDAPVPNTVSGIENTGSEKEEDGKKNDDVELGEIEIKRPRISVAFSTTTFDEAAVNQENWKEIARALDRIFFWFFVALIALSSFVVYGQAGRLSSIDTF